MSGKRMASGGHPRERPVAKRTAAAPPPRPRPVKLTPPDASTLVARPRLHRLADARRGGVVWVSGPAGSGKSSFVATWCASLGKDTRVLWHHVDTGDADPASLFSWLARGLGDDASTAALPAWSMEQNLDPLRFGQRFFRAWIDALALHTVVVLDNVHDAAHAPLFCALTNELARAKRADVTLVLSSRHVPADALLPVTTHPRFSTIGWPDLRCTDDEARTLAQAWDVPPPTPTLLALADGWVSALVVMLRYAHLLPSGTPDVQPDPAGVFESLAGSAFDGSPQHYREALMLGAFAPSFDARAIEAVSGLEGVADVLEDVWRRHFFLERHVGDAGRDVYVGHPLLRAFLRERAWRAWGRDGADARVRALAAHLAAAGDATSAASTYEAIDAWREVAPLVLAQGPRWLREGRIATIAEWLRKFEHAPAGALDDVRPALDGWHGTLLALRGDAAAFEWLERAHRGHLERGDAVQALLAVVARMEAYFLLWQQWSTARTWADELARLFDQVGHTLPRPLLVRVLSCGSSLIFPCLGHPVVERFARIAHDIVRHSSDPGERIALAAFVIGHGSWTGRAAVVREVAAIAAAAATMEPPAPVAMLQAALAVAVAAYNDGRAADPLLEGSLDRAFDTMQRHDLRMWELHCWLARSAERLGADDIDGVEHALARCRALCAGSRSARLLLLMRELMALNGTGRWSQAAERAQAALDESHDLAGYVFGKQYVLLQLAMAGTMTGMPRPRIEELLREPTTMARETDNHYLAMTAAFVRAALHRREGDTAAGDDHLARALATARAFAHRHLHPTRAGSIPFYRPLLARALEVGIETEWVSALIRRQRVPPPDDAVGWPYRIRIVVMGRFDVIVDGRSLLHPGKGKPPARALELLSYLALHGHDAVPSARIADTLWPDAAGDSGALEITLHRARKLLDEPTAIVQAQGSLRLNPHAVGVDLVDADAWRRRCDTSLESVAHDGRSLARWLDDLLACWGGPARAFGDHMPATSPLVKRVQQQLPSALRAFRHAMRRAGMAHEGARLERTLVERDPRLAPLFE